jgi:hypothetical protein
MIHVESKIVELRKGDIKTVFTRGWGIRQVGNIATLSKEYTHLVTS